MNRTYTWAVYFNCCDKLNGLFKFTGSNVQYKRGNMSETTQDRNSVTCICRISLYLIIM